MNKTFEIEWDSLEDVINIWQKFNSRRHELEIKYKLRKSKKEASLEKLDAMNRIFAFNIDKLYEEYSLDDARKYYVYCHMNTEKPLIVSKSRHNSLIMFSALLGMNYMPFYIGKGTGNRINEISRNETHRKVNQFLKEREKK